MSALPDYDGGSIVNLMSSISASFGGSHLYKPLKLLNNARLRKNVVLMIIDGLGFDYLSERKDSFIYRHLVGSMTSVFPPTTASAITTFFTGVAPQQHAVTGWFMYLKEPGIVVKPLPFSTRSGSIGLNYFGVKPEDVVDARPFTANLEAKSFTILERGDIGSEYNKSVSGKAATFGYSTFNGFFRQVKKSVSAGRKRRFVHAYWGGFDSLAHKYGVNSNKVAKHFKELDKAVELFADSIEGANTTIMLTSDHGFIDTDKSRVILLDEHPNLKKCLTAPLSGEARAAYCYLHPHETKRFEQYVRQELGYACSLHKSMDLVRRGYFGLFSPNKKLLERIGDYALIMKENYIIRDFIPGEKRKLYVGYHGGTSREEMLVPLAVLQF